MTSETAGSAHGHPAEPEPERAAEENRVTTGASSRSGRNLPAAIAVGVLLGAAVLVSLLTVRHIFVGIVAVAIAAGTIELTGALKRGADMLTPRTAGTSRSPTR